MAVSRLRLLEYLERTYERGFGGPSGGLRNLGLDKRISILTRAIFTGIPVSSDIVRNSNKHLPHD